MHLGQSFLFWKNLGTKLKFRAPMISSVGKLQLPVAYFFNPRRRCPVHTDFLHCVAGLVCTLQVFAI